MKITVLGCGALGQIWLSALHQKGHQVQGWLRAPLPCIRLKIIDTDGKTSTTELKTNDPRFLRETELLLVTLKAWQVSEVIINLHQLLTVSCPILLLHNGMGTLEELTFLRQPVLQGVTTHAAKRENGMVYHVATGVTHIGPGTQKSTSLRHLATILHQALPDVVWHNSMAASSWQKLAANCVINPLTAIYDCCNRDLFQHGAQISRLCKEIVVVMQHEGVLTSYYTLLKSVSAVIASSADNLSSMLQDIRQQRRTEIEYITGYLLRRARAHGIDTPENNYLYQRIKKRN